MATDVPEKSAVTTESIAQGEEISQADQAWLQSIVDRKAELVDLRPSIEKVYEASENALEDSQRIDFTNIQVLAADERPGIDGQSFSGSHKDRAIARMLLEGIKSGQIKKNTRIVDYTTGSAGIALAQICERLGLACTVVMPENITKEREDLIIATGATLILTPADSEDVSGQETHAAKWVEGAVLKANEIVGNDSNAFLLNQSANPNNNLAFHPLSNQLLDEAPGGGWTHAIIAAGTSATVIGIGEVFKGKSPTTTIVAVNAKKSPDMHALKTGTDFKHHPHSLFGTGPGAASPITQSGHRHVDKVILVDDRQCHLAAQALEPLGLEVGPTTAANIIAAIDVISNSTKSEVRIITVIFDHISRYRSVMQASAETEVEEVPASPTTPIPLETGADEKMEPEPV